MRVLIYVCVSVCAQACPCLCLSVCVFACVLCVCVCVCVCALCCVVYLLMLQNHNLEGKRFGFLSELRLQYPQHLRIAQRIREMQYTNSEARQGTVEGDALVADLNPRGHEDVPSDLEMFSRNGQAIFQEWAGF